MCRYYTHNALLNCLFICNLIFRVTSVGCEVHLKLIEEYLKKEKFESAEQWSSDMFSIALKSLSTEQLVFTCQRFLNQVWFLGLIIEKIMYIDQKWDITQFYFIIKTSWEVCLIVPCHVHADHETEKVVVNCSYMFFSSGQIWSYLCKVYLFAFLW